MRTIVVLMVCISITMGTPLNLNVEQRIGEFCGHDEETNTIHICSDGLNCEKGHCRRWVVGNREIGSECGSGLHDGRVDIGCVGGAECVDGRCSISKVPYLGQCDETRLCDENLDCVDGQCRKHLFYVAVDYFTGVAKATKRALSLKT